MKDGQNGENQNNDDTNQNGDANKDDANKGSNLDNNKKDDVNIDAIIEERLKPIKASLDKAYGDRDAAQKKLDELEKARRQEELTRLEAEGKHREAYEIRLAEERKAREAAEARAVELTRDVQLKDALGGFKFRSEKAATMAYSEIVTDLVKDANNKWIHKSGASISEFVKAYEENEANQFLFEPRVSRGPGLKNLKGPGETEKKGSLFSVSQDEVIKMAAEGKLPHQRRK